MKKIYTTQSHKETQKIGEDFAKEALKLPDKNGATLLALHGNLGAGKTTFIQGFAKGLGIKTKVLSPTFVIMKKFKVNKKRFKTFYHFDCYRLKGGEILELGFKEIISDPKNIIAVEWPEKIKKFLPKDTLKMEFKFIDLDKRKIIY